MKRHGKLPFTLNVPFRAYQGEAFAAGVPVSYTHLARMADGKRPHGRIRPFQKGAVCPHLGVS